MIMQSRRRRRSRVSIGLMALLVMVLGIAIFQSSVHASGAFDEFQSLIKGKSAEDVYEMAMGYLDEAERTMNSSSADTAATMGTSGRQSTSSDMSSIVQLLIEYGISLQEARHYLQTAFNGASFLSPPAPSTGTRSFSMQDFHQTTVRSANSGGHPNNDGGRTFYDFFGGIPVKLINEAKIATGCPIGKCCANPKNIFHSKHLSTKVDFATKVVPKNEGEIYLNSIDQSVNDAGVLATGGFFKGDIILPKRSRKSHDLLKLEGNNAHYNGLVALADRDTGFYKWAVSITGTGDIKVKEVRISPTGKKLAVVGSAEVPIVSAASVISPKIIFGSTKGNGKEISITETTDFLAIYDDEGVFKGVSLFPSSDLRSVAFDPKDESIVITGKLGAEEICPVTKSGSSDYCYAVTINGDTRAFIAKFSACGEKFEWVAFIGVENIDIGQGVTVDREGFIAVTGAIRLACTSNLAVHWSKGIFRDACHKNEACNPGVHKAPAPIAKRIAFNCPSPDFDMFIARYSSSGKYVWAHIDGGEGSDAGFSVAVDSNSNIYVAGFYTGIASFGVGIVSLFLSTCVGCTILCGNENLNGVVLKYNAQGGLEWAANIRANGEGSNVIASGVSVDCRSQRVYATGLFDGKAAVFFSAQDPVTRFGFKGTPPFFSLQNERGEAMAFLNNARALDTYDSRHISQQFLVSYETSRGTLLGVEKAGNTVNVFDAWFGFKAPEVVADPTCGANVAGSFACPGALLDDNTFLKTRCPPETLSNDALNVGILPSSSITTFAGFLARFEDCLHCRSGNFVDLACRKCRSCPSGSISKHLSTKCEACPHGSFSSSCGQYCNTVEQCPPGKEYDHRRGRCRSCRAGTFKSDFGSHACQLCHKDTYSRSGATRCRPCRSGHRARIGSHKCVRKCSKHNSCGKCKDHQHKPCDKCQGHDHKNDNEHHHA